MTNVASTLWHLDEHTKAKHEVLRRYLDGWIGVMGSQALRTPGNGSPALLLVDGFAGPGRYEGGERGSPLIVLDALTSHSAFSRFTRLEFEVLLIEQAGARYEHLNHEVSALSLPANVRVRVEHGDFEKVFGSTVDRLTGAGRTRVPTFAFIDPFGYSSASMSLTGRLLDIPRSEALFFLPLSYIHRFVGRDGQEGALNALFDCDEWRRAIPMAGHDRRDFLANLFEERLRMQGQVNFTTSFQLRTADWNDYRLFFASGHEKGLELMKQAMWKVDPVEGTRYVARTETGQEVLFTLDADTTPLLEQLKAEFSDRWFDVQEAERATLLHTPFVPSSHLRLKTLRPAEKAGVLEVVRPEGARGGSFVDGVLMRFV
jgi:three-Cys-motif partner protein